MDSIDIISKGGNDSVFAQIASPTASQSGLILRTEDPLSPPLPGHPPMTGSRTNLGGVGR